MKAWPALLALLLLTPSPAQAGYTHYWTWLQKPDPVALQACIGEMRAITQAKKELLDLTGNDVVRTSDGGAQVFITFNGVGEDAHETFEFPGRPGFNFTKTAMKPYDVVVTAALLVARDHFPSDQLRIESDGSWSEPAWTQGAELYAHVTGRAAHNPMDAHDGDDPQDPNAPPHVQDKRWFWVLGMGLLAAILLRTMR